MYALVQNLRFAFRQLRKAPGFTLTVVPLNKVADGRIGFRGIASGVELRLVELVDLRG
jgi:hypothetical protein